MVVVDASREQVPIMGRKSGSKRQASLDARKQILKVRGDFLELSEDDEDDEVVEITEAPAKKYKVTARKSDGGKISIKSTSKHNFKMISKCF